MEMGIKKVMPKSTSYGKDTASEEHKCPALCPPASGSLSSFQAKPLSGIGVWCPNSISIIGLFALLIGLVWMGRHCGTTKSEAQHLTQKQGMAGIFTVKMARDG
jgi:hypothetical protein